MHCPKTVRPVENSSGKFIAINLERKRMEHAALSYALRVQDGSYEEQPRPQGLLDPERPGEDGRFLL